MIVFFDDEAGFVGNYIRAVQSDGWDTRYAGTVESLLLTLAEVEAEGPLSDDHVIVVDIMIPVRTGIAANIPSRLEVGIGVIELYLIDSLRQGNLKVIILTNKNPQLVQASLSEIGVYTDEIPVWTKNEVSALHFPHKLEEFLNG